MIEVMTFYRFVRLTDLAALQARLRAAAQALDLKGTILLAEEGINGTVAGREAALRQFGEQLTAEPGLADLPFKRSTAQTANPVFYRLKVRIRPEIVSFGQTEVDPGQRTGEHVDAVRWNALLEDPDVVVIDTRNGYEIEIGTFPGSRNPNTRTFRELPEYVAAHLDPARHRRVAMFCTGGIRCEKASAYLLQQGFETVYQLDGGILKYLETVPPEQNRWQGECFVFDQRVSVDPELAQGSYRQCYACRRPLSEQDLTAPEYEPGVSCPGCIDEHGEPQRAAFRERWRQSELALRRGARHVGAAQSRAAEQG